MLHRFFGGVRPGDRKNLTRKLPSVPLSAPPRQVILPLEGPAGGPLRPLVKAGDAVAAGQLLAAGNPRFAAVHASVSGRVLAVEPRLQSWGAKALSVVIENDGKDAAAPPAWEAAKRRDRPEDLTPGEIVEMIAKAGISGMGGGGFPTAEKLKAAIGKADTLILNGAECEPYLTADHRLMLERPGAVLGGARILMRALSLEHALVAVEGNKYDAANALRESLPVRGGDVSVAVVRARYPQGSEKQLIQRLTGRRVPSGKLPGDVGCAVFNVHTAAAVYDAVYDARPLVQRIVTVTGSAVAQPQNLLAPVGTPLEDLVAAAGGFRAEPDRVLAGGPMMGQAQFDLGVPLLKGTGAVVGMTWGEVKPANQKETACIRCGRCVEACPMRLQPVYLRLYADAGRYRELERFHIMDCIECGACAYACPARIRLVHSIRAGKQHLRVEKAREQEGGSGSETSGG